MSAVKFKNSYLLFLCLGLVIPSLQAQQIQTVSARNCLDQIRSRFGMQAVQWVAEVRATGGQPQPLQWDILAYDSRASGLLHHFRASSGVAQDGGQDNRRYPNDSPNGYFAITDIGVDSVAAFTIAEAEARKARMGFDSCDYLLKLREYSNETVWKLDLVDASHRLVGSVFISGTNGEVLRTLWVQRDTISGFPTITDSSTPSGTPHTGITGGDLTQRPLPRDTGIAGNSTQPFSPVSPDGMTRRTPISNTVPERNGIFREFPSSGGGGSPTFPPSTNPLDPQLRTMIPKTTSIPGPDILPPVKIDPALTGPAPPIKVPTNGGSSARIPPPPVPQ